MSKPSHFSGQHYLEWVEPIRNLTRVGDLDEALVVLYGCMDAVEAEAALKGWQPAPWFHEQAAIAHRTRAEYDAEVVVLQRYLRACAGWEPKRVLVDRLSEAQDLMAPPHDRPSTRRDLQCTAVTSWTEAAGDHDPCDPKVCR